MRLVHTALLICSVLAAHAIAAQCLKPYPVYDEARNMDSHLVSLDLEV